MHSGKRFHTLDAQGMRCISPSKAPKTEISHSRDLRMFAGDMIQEISEMSLTQRESERARERERERAQAREKRSHTQEISESS